MNAIDELWEYIQKKNMQYFHVTWGPDADKLTTEQRAEYL